MKFNIVKYLILVQNSSNRSLGLNNLNLASTLENPENFKKLFSNEDRGELAIDSMKLLAGPKASAIIDKLVNEVKDKATDSMNNVVLLLRRKLCK